MVGSDEGCTMHGQIWDGKLDMCAVQCAECSLRASWCTNSVESVPQRIRPFESMSVERCVPVTLMP